MPFYSIKPHDQQRRHLSVFICVWVCRNTATDVLQGCPSLEAKAPSSQTTSNLITMYRRGGKFNKWMVIKEWLRSWGERGQGGYQAGLQWGLSPCEPWVGTNSEKHDSTVAVVTQDSFLQWWEAWGKWGSLQPSTTKEISTLPPGLLRSMASN